jgi:hypothetical protein
MYIIDSGRFVLLLKVTTKTHKNILLLHAIIILALNKAMKEIQTHTDKIHNILIITRVLDCRKDSATNVRISAHSIVVLNLLRSTTDSKIPELTFIVVV